MLDEMKKILISSIQKELEQKKEIEKQIKTIVEKRNQRQKQAVLQLSSMEQQIKEQNNKLFQKIFISKKLINLYDEYMTVSHLVVEELNTTDEQIESLYRKLHDLSHDEILIEKELERVKNATSLQELDLTEKQALDYIKNDEKKVIKVVFKDIKDKPLETSTDIERNINALYQTNLSPFVIAIQKIEISDLIKELIEIGITVDEDKIDFINRLKNYILDPIHMPYPDIQGQERTDRLDHNFYNQVELELAHMQHYNSYPPLAVSKIVTLAILVSMAKTNKQEKQTQK